MRCNGFCCRKNRRTLTSGHRGHGTWPNGHMVGTVYSEPNGLQEMYGVMTGAQGRMTLKQFGVTYGGKQVVLVISPTVDGMYTPSGTRHDLHHASGEGLLITQQYEEIGNDFAAEMQEQAPELAQHVRDAASAAYSTVDAEAVDRQNANLRALFNSKDYRNSKFGRSLVESEDSLQMLNGGSDHSRAKGEREESSKESKSGSGNGNGASSGKRKAGVVSSRRGKRKGELAELEIPERKISWSRETEFPDYVVSDYASYGMVDIVANEDNEVFVNILSHMLQTQDEPGNEDLVRDAVKTCCATHLIGLINSVEIQYRKITPGYRKDWLNDEGMRRICYDAMTFKMDDLAKEVARKVKESKQIKETLGQEELQV